MNFEQLIDDARTAKSDMMLSKSLLTDAIRDRFLPAYCAYCLEHGQGVSFFKGITPFYEGSEIVYNRNREYYAFAIDCETLRVCPARWEDDIYYPRWEKSQALGEALFNHDGAAEFACTLASRVEYYTKKAKKEGQEISTSAGRLARAVRLAGINLQ